MQTLQFLASALAILLSVGAYVPYVIAMIRGRNRPHIFAWMSICLITGVVGLIQLAGGAGLGAWPTLVGAAVYLVIVLLCLRYGTKDIVWLDGVCLGLSVLGVAAYAWLGLGAAAALTLVTIAEVVGFLPTWRKTRRAPYSEDLTSYYLLMVKLMLVIIATQQYNFLTLANIVVWMIVLSLFIFSVWRWRRLTPQAARAEVKVQGA